MTAIFDRRYRVVRKLGEGATAEVFLVADQRRDDFPLALKLLRSGVDLRARSVFRYECRLTTRVR